MNKDQACRWAEEAELPESIGNVYTIAGQTHCTIRGDIEESTIYTEAQVREAIAAALVKLMQGQVCCDCGECRIPSDRKLCRVCLGANFTNPSPSQQEDRNPLIEALESISRIVIERGMDGSEAIERGMAAIGYAERALSSCNIQEQQ